MSSKKQNYCPNYSQSIVSDTEHGSKLIARTRCKMWSCDYCAKINRKLWQARIMNQVKIDTDKKWYFWTITLAPWDHDGTLHSIQIWRNVWDKLIKTLKRKLGRFNYLRVFEEHKDGTLHVHMLADESYDDVEIITELNEDETKNTRHHSAEFKKLLLKYGLGYIHDIQPITDKKKINAVHALVASYVTKYLTKNIQSQIRVLLKKNDMGRIRLIQTSQNWAQVKQQIKSDWTIGDIKLYEAHDIWKNGGKIVDINNDIELEEIDFHDVGHYPNKWSLLADIADNE